MTTDEIELRVGWIREHRSDDESAHSAEDALRADFIAYIATLDPRPQRRRKVMSALTREDIELAKTQLRDLGMLDSSWSDDAIVALCDMALRSLSAQKCGMTAEGFCKWQAPGSSASATGATPEAIEAVCAGRCEHCASKEPYTEKSKREGTYLFHALGEYQLPCKARDIRSLAAPAPAVKPQGNYYRPYDTDDEAPRPEENDSRAIEEIAAERARQIKKEGWDIGHDDGHIYGQLSKAAASYAAHAARYNSDPLGEKINKEPPPQSWPWEAEWWKPKNARRDLIRAAALIVAEVDRLDRQTAPPMNSGRHKEG